MGRVPGDVERAIADFVEHYDYRRYYGSLGNLTPADAEAASAIAARELPGLRMVRSLCDWWIATT